MNLWNRDMGKYEEEAVTSIVQENDNKENILQVRMFGTFSMSYNGMPLAMKRLRRNNQFTNLMQAVLYHSEKGVGRDWLEDVVFEDRDVENRHNSEGPDL